MKQSEDEVRADQVTEEVNALPFGMFTEHVGVIFSSWQPDDLCPDQRNVTPDDLRALGWVPADEACVDKANELADERDEALAALEALFIVPAVAPQNCFNTSHHGLAEETCEDCDREDSVNRDLHLAREKARAVLARYSLPGKSTVQP